MDKRVIDQLRKLVKPFVSAVTKLNAVQLLLRAAAARVITRQQFEDIRCASRSPLIQAVQWTAQLDGL